MEQKAIKSKLIDALKKYKYILIVLTAGILIINIPSEKKDKQSNVILPEINVVQEESTSDKLSRILSKISGAGEVSVYLSEASSKEYVYQEDSGSNSTDTVLITDASRNESGLVKQENAPIYRGAIIVCKGADNPAVQLSIVEAVSNVTGLGADKISVLKMK